MSKTLLRAGGIANLAFLAFHLWLGWKLHGRADLAPGVRALLETFNLGGALFIGFFAHVSLFRADDLLASRLGRNVLALIVLVYATRAAGEILFAPLARPLILATCLAMVALYLEPLLRSARPAEN